MDSDQDLNRPLPFSIDLNEAPPPPPSPPLPPPSDHDAPPPPPPLPSDHIDQLQAYEAYMIACRIHGSNCPPILAAPPAEFPGEAGFSGHCGKCGQPEMPGATMICDGCDRGFHMGCVVPPPAVWQRRIDEWLCPECHVAGVQVKRPLLDINARPFLDINAPPPTENEGGEEPQIGVEFQRANKPDNSPLSSFASQLPNFAINNQPLLPESSSRGSFYYPDMKQFMPAFNSGPGSMYLPMDIDSINDKNPAQRLTPVRKKRVRTNIFTYLGQNQNRIVNLDQSAIMDLEALQPKFADSSTPPKLPKYLIEENGRYIQIDLKAGFPVQFEDYYLVKLGEINSGMGFHNNFEIYPIGFTSYWHDKITGSLFEFEVSDVGNGFPVFTIRRIPCSAFPLPNSSTILYYNNNIINNNNNNNEKGENSNNSCVTTNHEEDIMILLDEPCQSDQDLNDFLKGNLVNTQISLKPHEIFTTDRIGEFFVQGDNLQSVWSKVSSTVIDAMCELYKQSGYVQFCCNHVNESQKINIEKLGNLSRFSHVYGPLGVPKAIRDINELEASSSAIKEWLSRDRLGLDLEFVQEIIENVLPACTSCTRYQLLCKRSEFLNFFTVANENLIAVNRNGEKGVIEGLYGSKKLHDKNPPLGKSLSKNLPAKLAAELFQIWEFLHRFKDAIGLKEVPSFEDLEKELINPWLETIPNLIHNQNKPTQTTQNEDNLDDNNNNNNNNNNDNTSTFIPIEPSLTKDASLSEINLSQNTQLAKVHTLLLKLLINETTSRVAGFVDPTLEIKEPKPRRGRKKETDNPVNTKSKSKIETLTLNVLTWPELARRYALAVMNFSDFSDLSCSDGVKIFRCLQGDGGVVFGAASGILGIETDAYILVEAQKQISDPANEEKVILISNNKEDLNLSSSADVAASPEPVVPAVVNVVPEWAQPLENVRKLPTNVGTRIRKCVFEALERNPPDWARKLLEHSISKEVYKGNASGPTKKLALSVLADATAGTKTQLPKPQNAPEKNLPKKEKISLSIFDAISKKCRIILRQALGTVSEKSKNFCNLLGTSLVNSDEEEFEGIIGFPCIFSRPLDFRTIDLRLSAGAYGGSYEAFLEDVREVFKNLRTVYAEKSSMLEKVDTLFGSFESLYESEVLTLVEKLSSYPSSKNPKETQEKEILQILDSLKETPKAPWEDGVCKVCGVDRDDKSVLLCDTCDSEYHTYCLNPPLARIPEGNWYCPNCVKKKKGRGKALEISSTAGRGRGLVISSPAGNKKEKRSVKEDVSFKSALTRFLESMEQREYWELSLQQRVFLLKFLCDELLNSALLRSHIDQCIDKSLDFQQKLRSLNFELRNLKVREEIFAIRSVTNFGNINSTSNNDETTTGDVNQINNETGEMLTNQDSNNNNYDNNDNNKVEMDNLKTEILALQDTIMDLESQLSGVCLRREFIGRDVLGRLYWFITRPDKKKPYIVVDGSSIPKSEQKTGNSNPGFSKPGSKSENEMRESFALYESDEEINALVNWLNDGDNKERELKESILSLQKIVFNKENCCKDYQDVFLGTNLVSPLKTKALTVLESRFGGFSNEEIIINDLPKRPKKKGKLNYDEKLHRCECLEPVWGSKNHCLTCHITFITLNELETHNNGKCVQKTETKLKNEGLGIKNDNNLKCPFDFEEICKKFIVKGSIKEDVQQIGLIGSNGVPTFITRPDKFIDPDHQAVLLVNNKDNSRNDVINSQNIVLEDSQNIDVLNLNDEQLASKEETGSDTNKVGELSDNGCTVPDAALRPVKGKNTQILKLLKINLLDMESALPDEALKRVKSDPVQRQKWRSFVKSSQSIYEMVQASVLLESMIKTEYIKNTWFHWSSLSAAAKTPNLTSLALRIYTLDDCIIYFKDLTNPNLNSELTEVSTSVVKSGNKGKKRKDLD